MVISVHIPVIFSFCMNEYVHLHFSRLIMDLFIIL